MTSASQIPKVKSVRSRGLIWVCDVARSSLYLNSDASVDDLEQFLPRLFWLANAFVGAAGGKLVKLTGDGFMGWFETELHRSRGPVAATIFNAASLLSAIVNVTQLGLSPERKFRVRHGVVYEQDALVLKFAFPNGYESLDMIGRAVVLAFRLSGIPAGFPGIVTQGDLVRSAQSYTTSARDFKRLSLSSDERLKYFKGERWGTESIYVSTQRKPRKTSQRTLVRQISTAIVNWDQEDDEQASPSSKFAQRFSRHLIGGPEWFLETMGEWHRFLEEDLVGSLRSVLELMRQQQQSSEGVEETPADQS